MLNLVKLLSRFNRKERYFLIKQALGTFHLSPKFRKDLACVIGLDEIPSSAFAAMDYHLDWIAAALHKFEYGGDSNLFNNPKQHIVTGNQRDVDLLVAFANPSQCHIVMIEAKADSSWDNDQMNKKAKRLKEIFGSQGCHYRGITPHFCLISPCPPQKLETDKWPRWMKMDGNSPYCLKLDFPSNPLKPVRCDENRNNSAKGGYFRIDGWLPRKNT